MKDNTTIPQIESSIDFEERVKLLGLNPPTTICFVPRNIADATTPSDLIHESEITSLRKLFRLKNIQETPLEPTGTKFPTIAEKHVELALPTLYVVATAYISNPALFDLAFGVISNYVADWFKGMSSNNSVKFSILTKRPGGETVAIKYRGPQDGMKQLPKILDRVIREPENE